MQVKQGEEAPSWPQEHSLYLFEEAQKLLFRWQRSQEESQHSWLFWFLQEKWSGCYELVWFWLQCRGKAAAGSVPPWLSERPPLAHLRAPWRVLHGCGDSVSSWQTLVFFFEDGNKRNFSQLEMKKKFILGGETFDTLGRKSQLHSHSFFIYWTCLPQIQLFPPVHTTDPTPR